MKNRAPPRQCNRTAYVCLVPISFFRLPRLYLGNIQLRLDKMFSVELFVLMNVSNLHDREVSNLATVY